MSHARTDLLGNTIPYDGTAMDLKTTRTNQPLKYLTVFTEKASEDYETFNEQEGKEDEAGKDMHLKQQQSKRRPQDLLPS